MTTFEFQKCALYIQNKPVGCRSLASQWNCYSGDKALHDRSCCPCLIFSGFIPRPFLFKTSNFYCWSYSRTFHEPEVRITWVGAPSLVITATLVHRFHIHCIQISISSQLDLCDKLVLNFCHQAFAHGRVVSCRFVRQSSYVEAWTVLNCLWFSHSIVFAFILIGQEGICLARGGKNSCDRCLAMIIFRHWVARKTYTSYSFKTSSFVHSTYSHDNITSD